MCSIGRTAAVTERLLNLRLSLVVLVDASHVVSMASFILFVHAVLVLKPRVELVHVSRGHLNGFFLYCVCSLEELSVKLILDESLSPEFNTVLLLQLLYHTFKEVLLNLGRLYFRFNIDLNLLEGPCS